MRISIAVISAALCVSACGSEASGNFEDQDGETGSYSINEESGETIAEIKTKDGTATMRSGENVPVDLPDGFSLFPGAKVTGNTTFAMDDASGALIMFESEADPDSIAEYYRKQAEAAGVELEMEMSINGGKMLAGKNESGRTFTLNVSRDGDMSSGQLMVGEKMGQ